MTLTDIQNALTPQVLAQIFPASRADEFFDALFGDASEGAYDIELGFRSATEANIVLELKLHERPGRCLACNLTYGLPQVFSRHPIINVQGIVNAVCERVGVQAVEWSLGTTQQQTSAMHIIPLTISLA